MNRDDNKQLYQFLKRINKLFKQEMYQAVSVEFENNGTNISDLRQFYPLYARVKYIRSVVLRKTTQWYQVWFQESSICLSPNLLPYIPENYFDDWINTFYSVGKTDTEQWLQHDTSLNSDSTTFLKVNASFNKKYVREGEPVEIEIMMISTLPKSIHDASVAIQVTDKTSFESVKSPNPRLSNRNSYPSTITTKTPPNLVDTNNQANDDKHTQMFIVAEHQSITPNKRLFFKSSISFNNVTNVVLTDVVLIINTIKLIFNIETSTLSLPKPSISSPSSDFTSQFIGNLERSRELHIEPRDSGCTLSANLPPNGFVDVPAPFRIIFTTSEIIGYSIILNITCSEKDIKIFSNADMSEEIGTVKIDATEQFKAYELTFYVFSTVLKEIAIQLKWHVLRDGKKGKTVIQDLPFKFEFPFKLKTKIFRECSSCRTEIDVFKTPLLTESSYSILTDFTVKSSCPVTIESFEIMPDNGQEEEDIFLLHTPIKSIQTSSKPQPNDLNLPEINQSSKDQQNDNQINLYSPSNSQNQIGINSPSNSQNQIDINSPSNDQTTNSLKCEPASNHQTKNIKSHERSQNKDIILIQKPIINLPISLEPKDHFSAFTKFSTTKKEKKAIGLGTIKIRYFMHSTTYEGTHVYTYMLPGFHNENKTNAPNHRKKELIQHHHNTFLNNLGHSFLSSPNSPVRINNLPRIGFINHKHQIAIEKLKLRVEFDFPPRGSQFEMCEMSLKITNVSDTPLELVVTINKLPAKPTFFMTGSLNTQIGIFPFDPIELPLKFFPLAHGSLQFPRIAIKSAQDWDYCYWEAQPTIFISYPSSS